MSHCMDKKRFNFGQNWLNYIEVVDDERLLIAKKSLVELFGEDFFTNKDFLDVGCGSGLFSLAAIELGARKVFSFDFDPLSVKATKTLKEKYYPQANWHIQQGDVLNAELLKSIGQFDYVYSWGVLHHTGNLEQALNNIIINTKINGKMVIAIYNDQGFKSNLWYLIKKIYCKNILGRYAILMSFLPFYAFVELFKSILNTKKIFSFKKNYKQKRGMSFYFDLVDWLGGYPFEVAKPEKIFHFYKNKGFILENILTTNRLGCNQFTFKKIFSE